LSFSYGYGKMQLVLHEEVDVKKQGDVIDIPKMKFYTWVMRGRFHPDDEHLYLCGMGLGALRKISEQVIFMA